MVASMGTSAAGQLNDLLAAGPVLAPGAYDALSARLAAQAGAKAVYLTGFGIAGSLLGVPDIGIVDGAQMRERTRALAAACAPVPLIADGDTGHGDVAALVHDYAAAGAAAIQIEDQVFPKRCGHMENKQVVPRDEARARMRLAARAARDAGILLVARTDARAVHGFDEALARAGDFLDAGAGLLFVEAPQGEEELAGIAERFRGAMLVANMVEDGKTPYLDMAALAALGYRLMIYPVTALLAVTERLSATYAALLANGRLPKDAPRVRFADYNRRVGLDDWLAEAARAPSPDGDVSQ